MPRLSVNPVIYKKNKTEEKEATIAIRVSYQGMSRFQETDYRSKIMWFDEDSGLVKPDHHNHALANASIAKQRAKIERDLLILKEEPDFSIRTIEKYLQPQGDQFKKSFSSFVRKYCADELSSKDKAEGTVTNYEKNLNKLHEFAGKENISFTEIDAPFLREYKTWLVAEKDNSPNTIWDSITKFICKFFNEAKIPLPDYKWPRPVPSSFVYLTMDELDRIEQKLPVLTKEEYTDAIYFMLECYSGIRHSDWNRFSVEKLIHGDSFKVRAHKNSEPIYLSLKNRPRLKSILDKIAEHPYTSGLEQTNRNLKVIAAKADIDKKVSTHTGRHTCATLHAELGFSMEYVAELLGISMATVKIYYKITRQKLRKEDERLQGL